MSTSGSPHPTNAAHAQMSASSSPFYQRQTLSPASGSAFEELYESLSASASASAHGSFYDEPLQYHLHPPPLQAVDDKSSTFGVYNRPDAMEPGVNARNCRVSGHVGATSSAVSGAATGAGQPIGAAQLARPPASPTPSLAPPPGAGHSAPSPLARTAGSAYPQTASRARRWRSPQLQEFVASDDEFSETDEQAHGGGCETYTAAACYKYENTGVGPAHHHPYNQEEPQEAEDVQSPLAHRGAGWPKTINTHLLLPPQPTSHPFYSPDRQALQPLRRKAHDQQTVTFTRDGTWIGDPLSSSPSTSSSAALTNKSPFMMPRRRQSTAQTKTGRGQNARTDENQDQYSRTEAATATASTKTKGKAKRKATTRRTAPYDRPSPASAVVARSAAAPAPRRASRKGKTPTLPAPRSIPPSSTSQPQPQRQQQQPGQREASPLARMPLPARSGAAEPAAERRELTVLFERMVERGALAGKGGSKEVQQLRCWLEWIVDELAACRGEVLLLKREREVIFNERGGRAGAGRGSERMEVNMERAGSSHV